VEMFNGLIASDYAAIEGTAVHMRMKDF